MNKFYLVFLTSAFCHLTSYIFSQSTAIIGTGTNFNSAFTYPAPYGNYYWGAKHQILIRASEMTAAGMGSGNISALAFSVQTPQGTPLSGFAIRMKTTTATNVTASFDNTGFTTVFGPQTYTESAGWSNHTFATPFAWNGTSNILIQVCFNNTNFTQNAEMYYTPTAYNSVVYFNQDMNNICTQPSGTTSMNRPNIRFTYSPNGPPTVQFTANPTATCSGNVSFTDQSFYSITAWLWNFGDGATSTIQNPTHTYTASGTYSVSLKATNANGNNTLVKPNYINVSLSGTPLLPAACTPTTTAYCCGFGITNFQFNKINNNSPDASEGYGDYTCTRDTVTTGQSYTVSVSTLTPSSHNVRVWIDFNNDGTFNPTGELVFSADNSFTATGSVFIPGTATTGTFLRMRVSTDHSLQAIPTPCSNPQYGQAEDYAVYIKPNTSPPVAKFSADDTVSCSGTVQFTDQSLNVPSQWLWNFGDGGTSTQQSPAHTYTANGTYSVSLTATNANGNNSLTKTSYILVTLGNIPVTASCQPVTLSYCCGYGIYKVQFSAINKSSADGTEGYKDFSCNSQATLTEGQSYTLNVQTSPSLVQDTKMWIDFNSDGTFQTSELLFDKPNAINPSGSITIPTGVAVYNKVLRMRVVSDNGGSGPAACGPIVKGQVEDYGVKILQFVDIAEIQNSEIVVQLYPNPSNGLFTIQSSSKISSMEILNVLGEKIYTTSNNPRLTSYEIDLRKQPKGIYFYKLTIEEGNISSGKIIIE